MIAKRDSKLNKYYVEFDFFVPLADMDYYKVIPQGNYIMYYRLDSKRSYINREQVKIKPVPLVI